MSNLKKITIPANGPGPIKEMAKRVKKVFADYRDEMPGLISDMERDVLAIIKEYDIADAMRSFDTEKK